MSESWCKVSHERVLNSLLCPFLQPCYVLVSVSLRLYKQQRCLLELWQRVKARRDVRDALFLLCLVYIDCGHAQVGHPMDCSPEGITQAGDQLRNYALVVHLLGGCV